MVASEEVAIQDYGSVTPNVSTTARKSFGRNGIKIWITLRRTDAVSPRPTNGQKKLRRSRPEDNSGAYPLMTTMSIQHKERYTTYRISLHILRRCKDLLRICPCRSCELFLAQHLIQQTQ